jgi:hypothetical protein
MGLLGVIGLVRGALLPNLRRDIDSHVGGKESRGMRLVLVHYHLFKNAGTTIDGILARSFAGAAHGQIEGPEPWSTVSPQQLLDYVLTNPALQLVSSHQARLPVPTDPRVLFLPILFLRHPIDRFASVYEYERRQPVQSISPSAIIARDNDLRTFAKWTIGQDATAVCRNYQVIHLADAQGDMRFARATHEDYLQALKRLKELPVFGLVDSFEESLLGLQQLLRPHIGAIDLDFIIENASPGRSRTLTERLDRIESELGSSLYRNLLEVNALDMLLYHEAQQMFSAIRAGQRTCA